MHALDNAPKNNSKMLEPQCFTISIIGDGRFILKFQHTIGKLVYKSVFQRTNADNALTVNSK